MIRSDSGVTHRLSLSARVVSAVDSQVKTKRQGEKRLRRLQNRTPQRLAKFVGAKLRLAKAPPNHILPGYYMEKHPGTLPQG